MANSAKRIQQHMYINGKGWTPISALSKLDTVPHAEVRQHIAGSINSSNTVNNNNINTNVTEIKDSSNNINNSSGIGGNNDNGNDKNKGARLTHLPANITVVSYNIWFGNYHVKERMQALGQLISSKNPHLISLQEVTCTILPMILSQPWAQNYYVSDPMGEEIMDVGYGVIILSRVPFTELFVRKFPSALGRKAVYGLLQVENSKHPVLFGTFHLESYPQDEDRRKMQMEMYLQIAAETKAGHVILSGDSNFAGEHERSVYEAGGLLDTWHQLYQKTPEDEKKNPGITFDIEFNPMATMDPSGRPKRGSIHSFTRLDRLFYSPSSVKPSTMEIIGTEPIDVSRDLWPSDHYGIHVKLELMPTTESFSNLSKPKIIPIKNNQVNSSCSILSDSNSNSNSNSNSSSSSRNVNFKNCIIM